MHLLAAQPGVVDDGSEAIDLQQTPGDIIVLSAADTDLRLIANGLADVKAADAAVPAIMPLPTMRLGNILLLGHHLSVDLYCERVVQHAKLVVVRLIGGAGYWDYGVAEIAECCEKQGIPVAFLPGTDQPDEDLQRESTVSIDVWHTLWRYFQEGGAANGRNCVAYLAAYVQPDHIACQNVQPPRPLPKAGFVGHGSLSDFVQTVAENANADAPPPVVLITAYRAMVQAGRTKVITCLVDALRQVGVQALACYGYSFKDAETTGFLQKIITDLGVLGYPVCGVVNLTGFAIAAPGQDPATVASPFLAADLPVWQVIGCSSATEVWENAAQGVNARDLAMSVALPEVDGRIITRAVAFKGEDRFDTDCQCSIAEDAPQADRLAFVATLVRKWCDLKRLHNKEKRIAISLANYPNKNSRIGNGVGLDAPQGVVDTLARLQAEGYTISNAPTTSAALMQLLLAGPTNDRRHGETGQDAAGYTAGVQYDLAAYQRYFTSLPATVQALITDRWGAPEADPFVKDGAFHLPAHRLGNVVVGIQPARGYNIAPQESYHDPDLPPPHGYVAYYAWMQHDFAAHAHIHFGKHGNLEWLPGKSLALSQSCLPEVVFGAMPHFYPFIVNDPGEGTQAKRRAQAVILDHLTPPLTRAESYGDMRKLEELVDEYYQAAGMDRRRLAHLQKEIIDISAAIGLSQDIGLGTYSSADDTLSAIDNYLCELKELQIRDGLHVFGTSPSGDLLRDLALAILRAPRGRGVEQQSFMRAMAQDLGFAAFDPLDTDFSMAWQHEKPICLQSVSKDAWRTAGDTVERLELLAQRILDGTFTVPANWAHTQAVYRYFQQDLQPKLRACGANEMDNLLHGLAGGHVLAGASGAPSRGRPDVLPTGRNFYSVDCRSVPTQAAWALGWKSATLLLERHFQDHGEFPTRIGLSAWGTANMRTGGDDIAQALALLGVRPRWDDLSSRVIGFEILPLSVLGRPRVDVVFRVSGFFRDAFPQQLDVLDSAIRAVAALDEPADENPIAAHVNATKAALVAQGHDDAQAEKTAASRVIGSKPGAYGAGMQALIDEGIWHDKSDFAAAYVAWGSYAYGGGQEGTHAPEHTKHILAGVQAVVQNQDNREHDILDSDDYYQFQGGMAATVTALSGREPAVYHGDTSRTETPIIRTLSEEIGRIVRGRAANPKWINGVKRHGYKGAFEMVATVDYLFAYSATTSAVESHHYQQLFDAYLGDAETRNFIQQHNPDGLQDMAQRFQDAITRGLWPVRSNSVFATLDEIYQMRIK